MASHRKWIRIPCLCCQKMSTKTWFPFFAGMCKTSGSNAFKQLGFDFQCLNNYFNPLIGIYKIAVQFNSAKADSSGVFGSVCWVCTLEKRLLASVTPKRSALMCQEGDLDETLRSQLQHGFPELEEWTSLSTLRRMLRASQGTLSQAVPMLMKAIECRVRERELFRSMRCQVACDMRIIGRDRENRPVIYMSARSQTEHLRELIPHVFLAFEARHSRLPPVLLPVLMC